MQPPDASDTPDRREPPAVAQEPDTARMADLPVEELPLDAPDRAQAAVDDVPADLDPAALARDTAARRDARSVMAAGAAAGEPAGQGNDQGRLEVTGRGDPLVVELALDASGRIGTARWLSGEQRARPQDERPR
jgi:hypothetical protein